MIEKNQQSGNILITKNRNIILATVIFSIIVLFLTGITLYFYRSSQKTTDMYNNSQKDCEEIIKLYQKDTSNSQRKIGDLDYKNNNVFVISNDLGITMPEGIGIVKGTILADNNSTYLINTEQQHVGGGLCKADEFKNTCDYYDETLPNIGILRIWRENKSNVFAINPQDISVNGKFLNRLIITKLTPNVYFTQSEIEFWKNALSEIISLK